MMIVTKNLILTIVILTTLNLSTFLHVFFIFSDDGYNGASSDNEKYSLSLQRKRSLRSASVKGHPWSDESDESESSSSRKGKMLSQGSDVSETDTTRRSKRMYFLF